MNGSVYLQLQCIYLCSYAARKWKYMHILIYSRILEIFLDNTFSLLKRQKNIISLRDSILEKKKRTKAMFAQAKQMSKLLKSTLRCSKPSRGKHTRF